MSFVNLLANDIWSEADIINRTEAILHSAVSKDDEQILSRKMIGFSLNLLIPSSAEQEQLTAYQVAGYHAQAAGIAAREDMALLLATMELEKAQLVLTTSTDEGERTAAQAIVTAATPQAVALAVLRQPIIEEPI